MAGKTNCKKNGKDYYRVSTTIGRDSEGKLIRKEFYGKNKTDAEAKKKEYLDNLGKGLDIDYKNAFLGDKMKTWLFEVVRMSTKPSTFEKYEGIYRNYIKESSLYGIRICDIKSILLQKHYNKLWENRKSSNSIKSLNTLLKSFFNYAVDEGYLLKNPCSSKSLAIPKSDEIDEDLDGMDEYFIFSDAEISTLESSLGKNRIKALIILALATGLRQGELLGLRWTDINMDNMELKVQRTVKKVTVIDKDENRKGKILVQTPKTKGSVRTVPIPSKVITILEKHHIKQSEEKLKAGSSYSNEDDYVFTTQLGGLVDSRNLRRAYERALKHAGLTYRKFHNLRHTYATKLFEADVPLVTVQKLLGHSNIEITANIYTHVIKEKRNDAAEKLNALFS